MVDVRRVEWKARSQEFIDLLEDSPCRRGLSTARDPYLVATLGDLGPKGLLDDPKVRAELADELPDEPVVGEGQCRVCFSRNASPHPSPLTAHAVAPRTRSGGEASALAPFPGLRSTSGRMDSGTTA